jgi:hypothetical protein
MRHEAFPPWIGFLAVSRRRSVALRSKVALYQKKNQGQQLPLISTMRFASELEGGPQGELAEAALVVIAAQGE